MARLGLAGSSGNSSGTTAIEVPRTFEEQLEEAHGVGDEYLAEAMEPDSNSVVHPLAAMIVTDSRQDVRGAASQPPMQTVAQEKVMNIQGGLGSQPRSYTPPILDRGYAHGGMVRGYQNGGMAEEENRLQLADKEYSLLDPLERLEVGQLVGEEGDLSRDFAEFGWDVVRPDAFDAGMAGLSATGIGLGLGAGGYAFNKARKLFKGRKAAYDLIKRLGKKGTGKVGQAVDFFTPKFARGRGMGAPRPRHERLAGQLPDGPRLGPWSPLRSEADRLAHIGKKTLKAGVGGALPYAAYSMFGGEGESGGLPEPTEAQLAKQGEDEKAIKAKFQGILNYKNQGGGVDTAGADEEDHPGEKLPYMDFFRKAYDQEKIYGEESRREGRAILMLQMASNLSQPGATVGRAFDNLAPLVAAQGQERRKSEENTRNVLSEISLALHRGELDLTDSEQRNIIGLINAENDARRSWAYKDYYGGGGSRGSGAGLAVKKEAWKRTLEEFGGLLPDEEDNPERWKEFQERLRVNETELSRNYA